MAVERCTNQNHTKMNVTVRFCSTCGEIVNKQIQKIICNDIEHAKSRKNGSLYCNGCGKNFGSSRSKV